jgi:hypothetical protein
VRSTLQSRSPGPSAAVPAHAAAPKAYREVLLVAVFILFSSFTYFLIQYDRVRTMGPGLEGWVQAILAGTQPAPIQYRIALPYLAHFLELVTHLRINQSLPLIEAVSYACALALLYLLFRGSPRVESAVPSHRFVLLGLFFTAAQFPVLWIFPWERSETLPTAAYLAAVVLLIVRRGRMPFVLVCLLALLLSVGQALVRADVPFLVGVAILLAAAIAIPFPRPRAQVATLGLLCCAAGAVAQLYLEHIAYPTAAYPPNIPKIQLLTNLNPLDAPLHIPIFLTALLPLIVSMLLLRRHRLPLEASDKLVLLMCLVYLPAWVTTGLMAEVRIFVPFLFLASPTIAKLWGAFLLNQDNGATVEPSA